MSSICQWRVPQQVSVTYSFVGQTFTFSGSGFAAFNRLEANCSEYRIKRISELMNVGSPIDSTPWALATGGPNGLVIGYIPIPADSEFQLFGVRYDYQPIIESAYAPRNPYCPNTGPTPDFGLGALSSVAQFTQTCVNPLCPDPEYPDPENPNCDTITTTGWVLTGTGSNYNPRRHSPRFCVPATQGVDFSYTDFANPNNYVTGWVSMADGYEGECYTNFGGPFPTQTSISVTF